MDGGYILAGSTGSNDGDVSGNHGGSDVWVMKMDANGNLQWQKTFGGSDNENAISIVQTTDGGYFVLASTQSPNNGDVTGNHGLVMCAIKTQQVAIAGSIVCSGHHAAKGLVQFPFTD